MSNSEFAARVMVLGYLRRRKTPRLLRDAAVSAMQSKLQAGAGPRGTDRMRAGTDDRALPADADADADAEAEAEAEAEAGAVPDAHGATDPAVPPTGMDLRALSYADLIGRFRIASAAALALDVPRAEAGVRAAIAAAASHNKAEMRSILDDLVRRVVQRGHAAQR